MPLAMTRQRVGVYASSLPTRRSSGISPRRARFGTRNERFAGGLVVCVAVCEGCGRVWIGAAGVADVAWDIG